MALKDKLITLLERSLVEEIAYMARLSPEELADPGAPDRWSPKDNLAHLACWKEHVCEIIEVGRRGEVVPEGPDIDAQNAELYRQYQNRSWDEVMAFDRRVTEQLITLTRGLSDQELELPAGGTRESEHPLWRRIVSDGFSHPLAHLAFLYSQSGRAEAAQQTQEEATRRLMDLSDDPDWRGTAVYNLACYYALAGEPDRALEQLRQALQLAPRLAPWSREDPDLRSLHGAPAYEALYREAPASGD